MLVDIDKIIVGDRIRRDFGDLDELAENIKKNGLLNPITINNRYVLLAGERRLRACKKLGWVQVDVRMVESEDEAQDIEIELSENTVRRNFTGSELAEGIRRQMAIEAEKAQTRMSEGGRGGNISTPSGKARDKAGEAFGISGKQAEKVLYVADNADMLDPADFADWDEGKLSTNKAFQRIKAAQRQAEQERNAANKRVAGLQSDLADALQEIEALERQNDQLYDLTQQQQVVEHEVVREVIPEEYKDAKRRARELESGNRMYSEENAKLRDQLAEAQRQIESMSGNDQLTEAKKELAAFAWKYRGVDQLSELVAMIDHFLDN